MRKASFSVEKVSSNTDAHNSREHSPKYLIGCEKGKENEYIKYYDYDNFRELAEARYLEVHKQKMQSSQKEALFEEAVISLEEHHTKDDVVKLFESLNKKYTGHTLINLAIHRDEGHFVKDGIEYYPTMHILQKEDGNWYILDENDTEILEALNDKNFKPKAEDFKIKVNIDEFEKVYNYHAHAVFSRFDLETGKSARFQKSTMSERYKFVSEHLKLEYNPSKDRFVKKSINQHKGDLSATRNAKLVLKKELEAEHLKEMKASKKEITNLKSQNTKNKNEKEKLKEANKALEMQLKELNTQLQKQLSNREQHAQREALVKELKEELKNKTLTTETMQSKFAELEEKLKVANSQKDKFLENLQEIGKEVAKEVPIKTISEIPNAVKEVLNQNKALQEQKTVLADKVTDLEDKIVSRPNIVPQKEIIDEIQKIISEEFTKKEILESRIGKPIQAIIVKDSDSFLKRFKNIASQGVQSVANSVNSLKEEILQWKEKYNSLLEVLNLKDKEIANLKEKVRELSTKQQKEENKKALEKLVGDMEVREANESESSLFLKNEEIVTEEKAEKNRGISRSR